MCALRCFMLAVGLACFAASANALAQTRLPEYTDAELTQTQQEIGLLVTKIYSDLVLQFLPQEQVLKLRGLRFSFVLRNPELDPADIRVLRDDKLIEFSATTMRFWRDVAIADAWLLQNGYVIQSVNEYMIMLKHGGFAGTPPDLLDALCISETSLDDPQVMGPAQFAYESTLLFLLIHEAAHIIFNHPDYGSIDTATARLNEAQADSFATEFVLIIGLVPNIARYFDLMFELQRNRFDYKESDQWKFEEQQRKLTHPVSPERIRALAARLQERAAPLAKAANNPSMKQKAETLALQLALYAQRMNDPSTQKVSAMMGTYLREDSLGPRRAGEQPRPCKAVAAGTISPFTGSFSGELTASKSDYKFPIKFNLSARNDKVVGTAQWGASPGRIEGTIQGSTLFYQMQIPGGQIIGKLEDRGNGLLQGPWGDANGKRYGGGETVLKRDAE